MTGFLFSALVDFPIIQKEEGRHHQESELGEIDATVSKYASKISLTLPVVKTFSKLEERKELGLLKL